MRKEEAIEMIDAHKNTMTDPVELLHWTWLRVIVAHMTQKEWDAALERALPILAQ